MKKRIISLMLSVVVLVGCVVINNSNAASVTVGAGNGIDERLETAKEVSDFLAFVTERDISNMGATYSLMAAKSGAEGEEGEGGEPEAESKYKSASIHLSTQATAEFSSSNAEYTGGLISQRVNLSREFSIYINEESTYYVSKGVYSSTRKSAEADRMEVFNFDFEIAVIKDAVYIMFHDYLYVEDNVSRRIKPSVTDQWIEISSSMAVEMLSVDTENREALDTLREIVDLLDEHNVLDKEMGITDLDKDDFYAFYLAELEKLPEEDQDKDDEFFIGDDEDFRLTIDFSNTANPYFSIIYTSDEDETKTIETGYDSNTFQPTTTEVRITNKSNTVQEINICNINNTVINMDTDSVSLSVGEKDGDWPVFMFIVKETKKNDD